MDAQMLDGNALAGLLQEIFVPEMTTAIATCSQCGASGPIGAVHVFRGAGMVLRCPHCENLLGAIVEQRGRVWITFPGMRALGISLHRA
jgi:hypothetical protein